jgi:hypothetical protein
MQKAILFNNKRGWSLILLLFVMISFIAVFPLLFTHIETGSKLVLAMERMSQAKYSIEGQVTEALVNNQTNQTISYDFSPVVYQIQTVAQPPGTGEELHTITPSTVVSGNPSGLSDKVLKAKILGSDSDFAGGKE